MRLWSTEIEETGAKRVLGSLLFMLIPEAGLDEALEEVKEVWEFHSTRVTAQLQQETIYEPIAAEIVESVERQPVIALSE